MEPLLVFQIEIKVFSSLLTLMMGIMVPETC